jgi:hypothetical protein
MGELDAVPRLVVPAGLVIDERVRERLVRRLAAAPESVIGIASEVSGLAAGESYRIHVDWKALESSELTPLAPSTPIRGAVLLRPGVAFDVVDGCVVVVPTDSSGPDGASLLLDPGAPTHDPHGIPDSLEDASELGRPPFPRRPVLVLLGCEAGADADWVRRLANRLIRRDIEARIAIADPAVGFHRTRPCRPTEASIRALAPDIVVTLDRTAAAQIDGWCADNRSTVVVDFDRELANPMELISWQIGRAQGRLRARIGRHVAVPSFAAVVLRLCAGPQPSPPSDEKMLADTRRPVREHWATPTTPDRELDCVVLTGARDAERDARVAGLVDNLAATGASVVSAPATGAFPSAARAAGVVVLAGVTPGAELDALIAERRREHRPTVVDLTARDLAPGTVGVGLTETVAALASDCGRAVAPAGALYAAVRALGVRALALPTLFTRQYAATLRAERAPELADPAAPRIIGWRPGRVAPDYADAVAAGIELALVHDTNELEFVGPADALPERLSGHPRVRILRESDLGADPALMRRWAVHVWTPRLAALRSGNGEIGNVEIAGDTRPFEVASCLRVPSVMPAAVVLAVEGVISPFVVVESVGIAQEWGDALHHVLDDAGVRARRAQEFLRRADALDSPATAATVAGRFLGWALHPVDNRQPVRA